MPTRIKRYEERLDNLDTLLARIELEMGPQAQLEAREFRKSGLLGLGGQRMVEVIATLQLAESRGAAEDPLTGVPEQVRPAPQIDNVNYQGGTVAVADVVEQLAAGQSPDLLELGASALRATVGQSTAGLPPDQLDDPASRLSAAFGRRVADSRREQPRSAPATIEKDDIALAQQSRATTAANSSQVGDGELAELRGSLADIRNMLERVASQQQADHQLLEHARLEREMPPRPPTELDRLQETFRMQHDARQTASPQVAAVPVTSAVLSPELQAMTEGMRLAQTERAVFQRLLEWNIPAQDSLALLQATRARCQAGIDEAGLMTEIHREICRGILLKGGLRPQPGRCQVVALVGPTGVGKTTTIAKIAARAAFEEGRNVAVISLDNYRIAAVEQLRSYAEIMGIRFEVVFTAEEFSLTIDELSEYDLVLVDTAGRSPGSATQIVESAQLFSVRRPDEVHLVMTAGTLAEDMQQILENFAPLNCDQLIISKLDETRSLGGIYNISRLCSLPVSYFTVGQSVPEDIRCADPEFVNDWMTRGVTTK